MNYFIPKFLLKVVTFEKKGGGGEGGKCIARIVVIKVLLSVNLAANLENAWVSFSAYSSVWEGDVQPNRRIAANILFLFVML